MWRWDLTFLKINSCFFVFKTTVFSIILFLPQNIAKLIGIIKTQIREAILDGVIQNNYDEAENFMYKIAKELNIKNWKKIN